MLIARYAGSHSDLQSWSSNWLRPNLKILCEIHRNTTRAEGGLGAVEPVADPVEPGASAEHRPAVPGTRRQGRPAIWRHPAASPCKPRNSRRATQRSPYTTASTAHDASALLQHPRRWTSSGPGNAARRGRRTAGRAATRAARAARLPADAVALVSRRWDACDGSGPELQARPVRGDHCGVNPWKRTNSPFAIHTSTDRNAIQPADSAEASEA